MNLPQNPPVSSPWLPWYRRIMRPRQYLEYWLQDEHHQQWISDFQEINDRSIEFQDYVTKRITIIKSDHPIVYRITRFS